MDYAYNTTTHLRCGHSCIHLSVLVVDCLDMASNVVAIVRNEFAVRTWKSLHLLVDGGDMALQVVARVAANKGEFVYVEKKTRYLMEEEESRFLMYKYKQSRKHCTQGRYG